MAHSDPFTDQLVNQPADRPAASSSSANQPAAQPSRKEIRAVYDDSTIQVYQAYPETIAREAVALGTFGSHFKRGRMTWIKPSFLWMMYRCGWGQKDGQEHVLAIQLKREGFDFCVSHAVASSYSPALAVSREEWQRQVKTSGVRVQWDPERDVYGAPLPYRSIQLGLRGSAVASYVTEWIVGLTDITSLVTALREQRDAGMDITGQLPAEQPYHAIDGSF